MKPSLLPPRLLLLRWVLHTELLPRPSAAPGDNVIMVRESLLSNLSPPRDERTLRERVKHHTPEHLSVFFFFHPPFPILNVTPPCRPPHPLSVTRDACGGFGKRRKVGAMGRAERGGKARCENPVGEEEEEKESSRANKESRLR